MLIPTRYYALLLFVLFSAHYLYDVWREGHVSHISLSQLGEKWNALHKSGWRNQDFRNTSYSDSHMHEAAEFPDPREPEPIKLSDLAKAHSGHGPHDGPHRKANATFVILVRNSELKDIIESLKQLEDRFNRQFHYPYVFLNEQPFSDEFKRWTSEIISAPAYYGLIPPEHWYQPSHIDESRAAHFRQLLVDEDIIYGGSVSYRNMCRFNSGFFYRHPLMQQFQYYWRVEPGVKFFCDIDFDPFLYMQDHNKTYAFTISMYEYERTISSLWAVTQAFMKQHPEYLPEDNAMEFISDDEGKTYNLCHFWSNFEIADMSLWRGEAYSKYFEFLDTAGGFYYERWGDAPVHTLGAALFSRKDQIHFFREIGYRHDPYQHCPQGDLHRLGKCWCEEKDNFDHEGYSCTYRYERMFS